MKGEAREDALGVFFFFLFFFLGLRVLRGGRQASEKTTAWHNNNGHVTTSMLLPRNRREVANGDCMATIAAQFVKLHGNGGHAVAIGGCAASAWQYHGNRKA